MRPGARAQIARHRIVHAPLAGLRMAFLCDIHADRRFSDGALHALFARVQALSADILLLGGDLAEDPESLRRLLRAMRILSPPLGVFACMGNNDSEIADFAKIVSGRMRLLVNASSAIAFGAGRLLIGGVDDLKHGHPSARDIFPPRDAGFRLLLSHYPVAPDYGDGPRADLQLSGHTHGGQFNLFGLSPYSIFFELRAHRWISGRCKIGGVDAIVSNGIGMSRLPLRIGVPPQIHLVEFDK